MQTHTCACACVPACIGGKLGVYQLDAPLQSCNTLPGVCDCVKSIVIFTEGSHPACIMSLKHAVSFSSMQPQVLSIIVNSADCDMPAKAFTLLGTLLVRL